MPVPHFPPTAAPTAMQRLSAITSCFEARAPRKANFWNIFLDNKKSGGCPPSSRYPSSEVVSCTVGRNTVQRSRKIIGRGAMPAMLLTRRRLTRSLAGRGPRLVGISMAGDKVRPKDQTPQRARSCTTIQTSPHLPSAAASQFCFVVLPRDLDLSSMGRALV